MAKQIINTNTPGVLIGVGRTANDRSGDPLRTAFTKVNDAFDKIDANFTELYNSIGGGGGISISDFGEGFSLTASNKIVTNKLYSTNETQPTQHYRLELDTNGVVHLPDQSIINGATLKSVAGNYAGITAGPVGADEDSWMWVDDSGSWISTKYSTDAFQWHFGNDGSLTIPSNGAGIRWNNPDNPPQPIGGWLANANIAFDKNLGTQITNGVGGVGSYTWTFNKAGNLTLPPGGDILDSNGASVLGGGVVNELVNNTYTVSLESNGSLNIPGTISIPGSAGGTVTYTAGVDYVAGALTADASGFAYLGVDPVNWSNTEGLALLIAQPSGTAYTFSAGGLTYTLTTDMIWGGNSVRGNVSPFPGWMHTNVDSITFTVPQTDTVSWTFDSNGDLTTPADGAVSAGHLNTRFINFQTNDDIQVGQSGSGSFKVAMKRFQVLATPPTSSKGSDGDVIGCVAFSADYIYYCSGVYDGFTDIWHRVVWTDNTW